MRWSIYLREEKICFVSNKEILCKKSLDIFATILQVYEHIKWIPLFQRDFFSRRKLLMDSQPIFWYLDHCLSFRLLNFTLERSNSHKNIFPLLERFEIKSVKTTWKKQFHLTFTCCPYKLTAFSSKIINAKPSYLFLCETFSLINLVSLLPKFFSGSFLLKFLIVWHFCLPWFSKN